MQRLSKKQRGPKCSWCGKKATYRSRYFKKYGCNIHLENVQADTDKSISWMDRQTEADFELGL